MKKMVFNWLATCILIIAFAHMCTTEVFKWIFRSWAKKTGGGGHHGPFHYFHNNFLTHWLFLLWRITHLLKPNLWISGVPLQSCVTYIDVHVGSKIAHFHELHVCTNPMEILFPKIHETSLFFLLITANIFCAYNSQLSEINPGH